MDDWSPAASCSQCSICSLPLDKLSVSILQIVFFVTITLFDTRYDGVLMITGYSVMIIGQKRQRCGCPDVTHHNQK